MRRGLHKNCHANMERFTSCLNIFQYDSVSGVESKWFTALSTVNTSTHEAISRSHPLLARSSAVEPQKSRALRRWRRRPPSRIAVGGDGFCLLRRRRTDRDRRHSLAHPMRESVNAPTKQFPATIRERRMNGRHLMRKTSI